MSRRDNESRIESGPFDSLSSIFLCLLNSLCLFEMPAGVHGKQLFILKGNMFAQLLWNILWSQKSALNILGKQHVRIEGHFKNYTELTYHDVSLRMDRSRYVLLRLDWSPTKAGPHSNSMGPCIELNLIHRWEIRIYCFEICIHAFPM